MGQGTSTILMVVLMIAIFYFLLIRPENKRKKQAQEMRDSLKKGDVITTIGGIMGKIVKVNPESIIIETSDDRVRMELAKWAVSTNSNDPAGKGGKKKREELPEESAEESSETEEKSGQDPWEEEDKKD